MNRIVTTVFILISIMGNSQENIAPDSLDLTIPNRVSYSNEQTINGSVEKVFPLYCPIKEYLWIDGWSPISVHSNSGVIEEDCVFITPGHGGPNAVWYVTDYDTVSRHIEMIMVLPETVIMKLDIDVVPVADTTTMTTVTRSLTSIGNAGDNIIKHYTREEFEKSMGKWEKAMNYYLEHGEVLKGLKGF